MSDRIRKYSGSNCELLKFVYYEPFLSNQMINLNKYVQNRTN